ncbi:MAG: hypothetical protein ABI759_28640 [Candidatus Solibacter sp.]
MNRKWLRWYEVLFLKGLAHAQVFGCELSLEQFCASHALEVDDLVSLREHLENHGFEV